MRKTKNNTDARNGQIDEMIELLNFMRTPGVKAVVAYNRWGQIQEDLYDKFLAYDEDEFPITCADCAEFPDIRIEL